MRAPFENCRWCQGAGCLVCGSSRNARLQEEGRADEVREFFRELSGQDKPLNPELVPLLSAAIEYGKNKMLIQVREDHHSGDYLEARFAGISQDLQEVTG